MGVGLTAPFLRAIATLIELTQQGDDVLIAVKVVPNASRDKIVGELDGALKVSVTAAPERGAANKAVCKLLARTLNVRTRQVTIDAGQTSPRKTIRINAISIDDVKERLPQS